MGFSLHTYPDFCSPLTLSHVEYYGRVFDSYVAVAKLSPSPSSRWTEVSLFAKLSPQLSPRWAEYSLNLI